MAVPKKKTSRSRRRQRSANDGLKPITIVFDRESGEPKLPHRMSLSDGRYNGKVFLKSKEGADDKQQDS